MPARGVSVEFMPSDGSPSMLFELDGALAATATDLPKLKALLVTTFRLPASPAQLRVFDAELTEVLQNREVVAMLQPAAADDAADDATAAAPARVVITTRALPKLTGFLFKKATGTFSHAWRPRYFFLLPSRDGVAPSLLCHARAELGPPARAALASATREGRAHAPHAVVFAVLDTTARAGPANAGPGGGDPDAPDRHGRFVLELQTRKGVVR